MRFISWNVRGTKKIQILQEIAFLKRTHKPQLLFLLETLVNRKNILQILPKLGFEDNDFVDPVDHSGGLAVLWDNGTIHASVLKKDLRAIHMLVYDTIKKCNSIISGVYAPAQLQDKDSFWEQLVQMHHVVDIPWCIVSDLNELANPSEKKGGKRYPLSKFNRLNRFLDTINGISIPVNGNHLEKPNT